MMRHLTESEARAALLAIEDRRRQVVEEIGLPAWYWWSIAAGWVGLGLLADFAPAWLSAAGTLGFGAAHAAIAPRVLSGRHRSRRVSVHRSLVDRHTPLVVLGGLVTMVAASVGLGLALAADGAEHPVTIASVFIAVVIVLGGPRLLDLVRRRSMRGDAA
jgi:hypothetical protein